MGRAAAGACRSSGQPLAYGRRGRRVPAAADLPRPSRAARAGPEQQSAQLSIPPTPPIESGRGQAAAARCPSRPRPSRVARAGRSSPASPAHDRRGRRLPAAAPCPSVVTAGQHTHAAERTGRPSRPTAAKLARYRTRAGAGRVVTGPRPERDPRWHQPSPHLDSYPLLSSTGRLGLGSGSERLGSGNNRLASGISRLESAADRPESCADRLECRDGCLGSCADRRQ